MMCYKDKTFCVWSTTCANTECPRWFNTEKAQKQDLPVAVADFKTDTCGYIWYREALTLIELSDLTYDEIADIVGIPTNTVRTRMHRAEKYIKRSLQGQEDEG